MKGDGTIQIEDLSTSSYLWNLGLYTQINLQSPNLTGADEPQPPGGNPNGPTPPCGEYQLLSQEAPGVSVSLRLARFKDSK